MLKQNIFYGKDGLGLFKMLIAVNKQTILSKNH